MHRVVIEIHARGNLYHGRMIVYRRLLPSLHSVMSLIILFSFIASLTQLFIWNASLLFISTIKMSNKYIQRKTTQTKDHFHWWCSWFCNEMKLRRCEGYFLHDTDLIIDWIRRMWSCWIGLLLYRMFLSKLNVPWGPANPVQNKYFLQLVDVYHQEWRNLFTEKD